MMREKKSKFGKSHLTTTCDFGTVLNAAEAVEENAYLTEKIVRDNNRILPHKGRPPTAWYGEEDRVKWHEEIWTKAIDRGISASRDRSLWFVDSEVPCKGGQIDILIVDKSHSQFLRVAVLEAKVANEQLALRHAVFYALFIARLLPSAREIWCGAIAIPEAGESACNLSPKRVRNYEESCLCLSQEAKQLEDLKSIRPLPLLQAGWKPGNPPPIPAGSEVHIDGLVVESVKSGGRESLIEKGQGGEKFLNWLFSH